MNFKQIFYILQIYFLNFFKNKFLTKDYSHCFIKLLYSISQYILSNILTICSELYFSRVNRTRTERCDREGDARNRGGSEAVKAPGHGSFTASGLYCTSTYIQFTVSKCNARHISRLVYRICRFFYSASSIFSTVGIENERAQSRPELKYRIRNERKISAKDLHVIISSRLQSITFNNSSS